MIRKKKYLGAAGDYAKYELSCIKELAKLLKQTYKKTLQTVNLDDSLLKIISVNFDKKVTVKETAKELKAALINVAKKNPLDSFIEILSKLPKKQTETIKPKFPMKLPATVTIGKVKKPSRRINGLHTDKKSHNTKITVISGIKKIKQIYAIPNGLNLKQTINEIAIFDQSIKWKTALLNVSTDTQYKKVLKKEIKDTKGILRALKNYYNKIKK